MSFVDLEDIDAGVKFQRLSKDFAIHCRNDIAKKCMLMPKYILQGLNCWPDNKNAAKRWIVIASIASLGLMALAHLGFIIVNITQISKISSAMTTVSTTFETMAKLATMIYHQDELNYILCVIWHKFWPSHITCERRQNEIKFRSKYVVTVAVIFLSMAYISCAQFMAFPLVANEDELPLPSWYPFDFRKSPIYELMYIWQWFMNQIVICTLSGFDTFFNAMVMICSTQFQILQDVLENICLQKGKDQWEVIFPNNKSLNEMDVLIKCVKHHLKLISIVELMETIFTHIVFLQFVASTLAICVSCVGMVSDPSKWQHMLSYLLAHLLQFFIYCSVGNELTYQSGQMADAAYACDWELSNNLKMKKGLVMIIQRSQKPEALTVAGLMQLSYANFVGSVQLSFSFYTLLDSFV